MPPALILRACELYAARQVGLRGAAKLLKSLRPDGSRKPISAMTMADILRRRGFTVRESYRPIDSPADTIVSKPSANEAMSVIVHAEPKLAVPWSVGEDRPMLRLPSAAPEAPTAPPIQALVLDVRPVTPLPVLNQAITRATTPDPRTPRKTRAWSPETVQEALRTVGVALGQRYDLDPALPGPELDRREWEASAAWRRMLIACQWAAEEDRRWDAQPVAEELLDLIDNAPPPEEHETRVALYLDWAARALDQRDERRGAQWGLYAVFYYGARAVRELDPERSFANTDTTICTLFRKTFPEAPPGFRLVGT